MRRASPGRPARTTPPAGRLRVELLEDRTTPAVTFAVVGDFGIASSAYNIPNLILGAPDAEGPVAALIQGWNPDFLTTVGDNNYLFGEQFDANLIRDIELLMDFNKISPLTAQTLLDVLANIPDLAETVQGGGSTDGSPTLTFPAGTDLSQVSAGMYAVGPGVRVPTAAFPFFTTIAAVDDAADTITLSIPAALTIANEAYHFLPADLSLSYLDGLSHIDRNIGRYFSNFIYPYVPTSPAAPAQGGGPLNTGQFANGSPTGTNRFFPVPGNHDWADIESDNTFNPLGYLTGLTGNQLDAYLAAYSKPLSAAYSPGFKIGYTIGANGVRTDLPAPYFYSFTAGTAAGGRPLVEFFAFDSELADPYLNPLDLSGPAAATFTNADTIRSQEGQWLKDAMANSQALWKIPYFHHTPYTSAGEDAEEGLNGDWMQLPFQQWGADAVLYGHVHGYERLAVADPAIPSLGIPAGTTPIPYFMNGSGGAPLTGFLGPVAAGSQVRYNGDFGAQKVTADENRIVFEFYSRTGALIDSYALDRGSPSSPRVATVGQPLSFGVAFPNAAAIPGGRYALQSGPAGATIDALSGLVTWTPAAAGNATFAVTLSDPQNPARTQTQAATVTAFAPLGASPAAPNYGLFPARGAAVLTAADSGGGQVRVFDYTNGVERFRLQPYGEFGGGVRLATADVSGDGVPDVITGPGPGGGPNVKVYDGVTGGLIRSFFAFDPSFRNGVFVAAGDLIGNDGVAEIVVTPDAGGGAVVAVFDAAGRPVNSFLAFDPAFRGGLRVAVGDVNNDGADDVVVTAGPGGGSRVAAFSGAGIASARPSRLFNDFFAFESGLTIGFDVTVGDLTGDGFADIFIGAGPGGGSRVNVFDGQTLAGGGAATPARSFFVGPPTNTAGLNLYAADLNADEQVELLTAGASGGAGLVTILDPRTGAVLDSYYAADPGTVGGINLG